MLYKIRCDYPATHGSDNSISQYINAAENSAESQSRQSEILAELQELINKLIAQDPHHRGLAIFYSDVADIYAAMGDRAQSIIYRQKSLEIRENIGKQ
jgi:tetratricopeptide (TPR) repeat protein